MTRANASVLTDARTLQLESFPVPDEIGADEALLAVEANGMCGSDWSQYEGELAKLAPFPVVPGHETVGRLERVGDQAAKRWGVSQGARVAVESIAPCGACPNCRGGRPRLCLQGVIYGFTPVASTPSLSGGFAEYMVLRPRSLVYPLPEHLSTEDAVMFNPLGAGFDWAIRAAGTQLGDNVLILGPGQRGLCSVVAAHEAGAGRVIVAGRGRRPWKLRLAEKLGATHVIDTDKTTLEDAIRDITDGAGVDRAIDTTPGAIEPLRAAIHALRPEGTLVLGGLKHGADLPEIDDHVIRKALTVKGVAMVSEWGKEQAIRVLGTGRYDFSEFHTHTIPLGELDRAMRILGGEVDGEEAMHITVVPG